METTKIWKVEDKKLVSIEREMLPFEDYIQTWVENDISIISSKLIFIGSKVRTVENKEIDILAIDYEGDLVVIELKRDKTPRDVVAQSLDYAASCSVLNEDDINEIVYINQNGKTLEDLLSEKGLQYADIDVNENQKILIVGTSIDASTERIVRYLSSKSIQINVTTFSYYKHNNENYLARNILLEDQEIVIPEKSKRKREKSFFRQLFDSNKLVINMEVYFNPGVEAGHNKNDKEVKATIVNTNTKCLKYYDNQIYSFSSLRRKITSDLNITSINADWGYGSKYDWYTMNGTPLTALEQS